MHDAAPFALSRTHLRKLKASCARVKASDHIGTGFLIGRSTLLTCHHVVRNLPYGEVVHCTFGDIERRDATAKVVRCNETFDIALLDLTDPLESAASLDLGGDSVTGGSWYSYGFPGFAGGQGILMHGDVLDPLTTDVDGRPAMSLVSDMLLGPEVDLGGFSGSPILAYGYVIGMLFRVQGAPGARRIAHLGITYAVPVRALRAIVAGNEPTIAELFSTGPNSSGCPSIPPPSSTNNPKEARIVEEMRAQQAQKRSELAEARRLRKRSRVGLPPRDLPEEIFKGRVHEQRLISELIASAKVRIITIVGRGGMGKTTLACRVLRQIEEGRWPHTTEPIEIRGIVYMSTRTSGIAVDRLLSECLRVIPENNAAQLQKTWSLPSIPVERKIISLLEIMSDGLYIILLDNFEDLLELSGHVKPDARDVALFLDLVMRFEHGVKLVLTSREPVHFPTVEASWAERKVVLKDGISIEDGAALLRQLDNDDLGLKDAPVELLESLVACVHGIPRAIELIVSSLANDDGLTPRRLADELGTRTFPVRKEDFIRTWVEGTYRQLDDASNQILQALSVFARPVPLVAIEFLLQPFAPEVDVGRTVRRLVRTLLATADPERKLISLHPIDCDLLYCGIPEIGSYSRRALHLRAADYYAGQRIVGDRDWHFIRELEPQLSEFEHLVRAAEYDRGAIRLGTLANKMSWRGFPERAAAMLAQVQGKLQNELAKMHYHICKSANATVLGPLPLALLHGRRALRVARRLQNLEGEAHANRRIGLTYRYMGYFSAQAIQYFSEALRLNHEIGIHEHDPMIVFELSVAHAYLRQWKPALYRARQATDLARKREVESYGWEAVAYAHYLAGNLADAVAACETVLEIWGSGEAEICGYAQHVAALAAAAARDLPEAERRWLEATRIAAEQCHPRLKGICAYNLAMVAVLRDDLTAAARLQAQAADLLEPMHMIDGPRALLVYVRGLEQRDSGAAVRGLVGCARASLECPDLFDLSVLCESARKLATEAGCTDVSSAVEEIAAEAKRRADEVHTGWELS